MRSRPGIFEAGLNYLKAKPRPRLHKYLSKEETKAFSKILPAIEQDLIAPPQISKNPSYVSRLTDRLLTFLKGKGPEHLAEPEQCPRYKALLVATEAIPDEEYSEAQKRFGVDFRPSRESRNMKLDGKLQQYLELTKHLSDVTNFGTDSQLHGQAPASIIQELKQQILNLAVPIKAMCKRYQFNISAACLFNNEARFLKEWLEFHRLVGIEHFFLFINNSQDNYLEVLQPYLQQGIVDVISWNTLDTVGEDWIYLEAEALNCALRLARGRSKWLALIDTDEYLFPIERDNLNDALREFEPYGAVSVRYTVFGTNGVEEIPPDKLLITTLTKSCHNESEHTQLFKSIVRPEFVDSCLNSHYCDLLPGFINITEDFEPLNHRSLLNVGNKKFGLNHYWARDIDYFCTYKLPRLLNWGVSIDQCKRNIENCNAVERTDILRFAPALERRMFQE